MVEQSAAPIRTAIVRITIGSFSLAALLGVIALIGGGAFGAPEARILLTTLLVGIASVVVLCYLTTAGTPFQVVGVVGGAVVVVPVVSALFMIWRDYETPPNEILGKSFGVGAIVTATIAQACLLLVLGLRSRTVLRRLVVGTLAMAAVLAGLLSVLVLGANDPGSLYLRTMGVVAILDVLGTVVGAALSRFGPASTRPAATRKARVLTVSPELADRLAAVGERTGQPVEAVLDEAVGRYLVEAEAPVASADEP